MLTSAPALPATAAAQVAYAYLQGETTNSGRLDDANPVTQVSPRPCLWLAVVEAPLWVFLRAPLGRFGVGRGAGPCQSRCGAHRPGPPHLPPLLNTGGADGGAVRREQQRPHPAGGGARAADVCHGRALSRARRLAHAGKQAPVLIAKSGLLSCFPPLHSHGGRRTVIVHEEYLCSPSQAVRTVFNLAIGSTSPDMQSTAHSALLQMLNTVLKRVGQQIGVRWWMTHS